MNSAASARERVLAALHGATVRPVPVGAVVQSATQAQMAAVGVRWPEAHRDATLMAALAGAAHSVLGFDLVRVPFDQTIEASLVGCEVDFGDDSTGPSVRSHPLTLDSPLPPLPDLGAGRAKVVVDAIKILRRRLRSDAAVVGGLVGPFTLVCQWIGASAVLADGLRRPDAVRSFLNFAVQLGAEYARRQVAAGADAICVEDMSASLDLTSPLLYRNLILPAQAELAAAIGAPVILHVCGSNTKILDLLARTGADALSLESKSDLERAAALEDIALVGGVAPVDVLLHGTLDDVRRASLACLEAGVHILAPGCGLPLKAPTANLLEMARVARQWRG
jgi:[methyl-Co(III) methanol-specific corrinoid protein]:coenzyme M methyltransferase